MNTIGLIHPRYEWFQTDNFVSVSVFCKGLSKEKVEVAFEEKSLYVNLKLNSDHNWTMDFDLFHEILPQDSKFMIMGTKLEIKMTKRMKGMKWNTLEAVDDSNHNSTFNSYPSSSKHAKDWSKVEKSIEEEKAEGEQAVNQLFQQIYASGNDEVKKAMMKSFVESGGTCLSTDWNDVQSKKVEIRPPEGMEARKWES